MNFLLVKIGFIANEFVRIFRPSFYTFFLLFLVAHLGLSQPTSIPTQITDYVLYGGEGVFIGSSNTVNSGVIGSDISVISTGSSLINSSIFSQGLINLSNSNDVTGRISAADAQNLGGTVLNIVQVFCQEILM